MLIDFGEQTLSKTKSIHFICLLLRYSRFLCVYAQDHKYNSEEACKAIYHSFCRLEDVLKSWSSTRTPCLSPVKPMAKSSRPGPLKISVPNRISDSGYAIKRILKARGPIENSVGFVKKTSSARKVTCLMMCGVPCPDGWNAKPADPPFYLTGPKAVYDSIERSAMRPLLSIRV